MEKRKSKNGGSLCGRAPRRQLSRRSEGGSRPALSPHCVHSCGGVVVTAVAPRPPRRSRQSVCSFAPRHIQRSAEPVQCAPTPWRSYALCSRHLPVDLGRPRPAPVQCPVIFATKLFDTFSPVRECEIRPKVKQRDRAMANHHHLRPSAIQLLRGGPCRVEGWLNVCGEYRLFWFVRGLNWGLGILPRVRRRLPQDGSKSISFGVFDGVWKFSTCRFLCCLL